MTGLLLLLAGTALAPSAQAMATIQACTPPNPDAWVNACVTLRSYSKTVNAYTVDTTPDYTRVCPVNNVCVNAPVILSLLDPQTYTVNYIVPQATYSLNLGNVVDDVCDVVGIVCYVMELVAFTTNDGFLDMAIFEDASGNLIAFPLA